MKRLYMLLLMAAVCLFLQTAMAQAPTYSSTNANKTTERNNATWYTIKNATTGEYLRYEGFKFSMTTSPQTIDGVYSLDSCNMFYVTGNANAAYLHNYAAGTARICVAPNKWDETGVPFKIKTTDNGVFISQSGELAASDAFHYNSYTEKVDLYLGNDPNSEWVFEKITDFADIMGLNKLVDEAYNACKASISWGGNFFGSLDAWFDTRTLKDGWLITPITKKDHSTLSATLNDINKAQEILSKYSTGYRAIFNYAEIHNKDFATMWMSTNSTSLTVNKVQTTHTNVWKIVNIEGEFFNLYNEATNMYIAVPADGTAAITMTADKNQAGTYKINIISPTYIDSDNDGEEDKLVSATVNFESIENAGKYIVLASADAKTVSYSTSSSATGAEWVMTPVADVTIESNFYSLAANTAWQHPHYLQENEGLVQDACVLYTSNYPSDDDKSSTCNLIDGVYTTCFTTDENATNENHYLQAEFETPVQEFYFYLKTNLQRADARPTQITVSGSNDGNSFTKIGETISTGLEDALYFFSEKITCGQAYKHLRFTVNSVNVGNKAFSISEFYILPATESVMDCEDDIKTFYSTALYDAALRIPAADLIALEAKYYLEKTVSSDNPEFGQYRKKEWDALDSALDTYHLQTSDANKYTYGLALADALEDYKNSICSPLFVISSAWEEGFSKEWAIGCDPASGAFTGEIANYWDLKQWYAVQGHLSKVMTAKNSIQIRSAISNTRIMDAQHSSVESIEGWNALYASALDAYGIRLYNAPDYLTVDEYMDLGIVKSKPTTSSNENAAWYFTYVGTSAQVYDLDAASSEHMAFVESLASFGEIYRQAKEYNDNYDPTERLLGKYHYEEANSLTKAGFDNLYSTATGLFTKGPAKMTEEYLSGASDYTADKLNDLLTELSAHFHNFHLNDPPTGYYYRLRGRLSRNYITSTIDGGTIVMGTMTDGNGDIIDDVAAKSILYAKAGEHDGDANILMFSTGRYLEHDGTGFQNANYPCLEYRLDDKYPHENDGYYSQSVFIHTSKTDADGYYALAFNNTHYLCDNVTNATGVANPTFSNKHDWAIEVVTELPLEISAANVTSLCVPVELEIPEGITAYILTGREVADGSHLRVTDYEAFADGTPVYNLMPIGCGIIPAGLPVIIKGTQGVHYFPINYNANDDTDSDGTTKSDELQEEIAGLRDANWLDGTHDARFISEADGYTHQILSKKNGEVGMYKVTMKSAAERGITYISTEKKLFINQSHRAWLCYPTATISASGYSFAIGGTGHDTTGIDEVIGESGKVKGIYDLQGRKIDNPTKGIYIIDGKKILIK